MKRMLTAFTIMMLAAVPAIAESFREHTVADDADWVVHLDFDRFRGTTVAEAIRNHIDESGKGAALTVFRNTFQIDPRRDFHGLTLYGPDRDEDNAILVLRTAYDRDALLAVLQSGEMYARKTYDGRVLHRFEAKKHGPAATGEDANDTEAWGCFYDSGTIVAGRSLNRVRQAIDVLDGRTASLADTDNSVWDQIPNEAAFFAAGADLAGLGTIEHQQAALLQQADGVVMTLDEENDMFSMQVQLAANSPEVGAKVYQVAQGLVALLKLNAANQPDQQWLKDVVQNIRVRQDHATVSMSLEHHAADVARMIETRLREQQSADADKQK